MKRIKVVLVDDEPIVLDDMKAQIDWEANGFEIVGCAYSAEGALQLVRQFDPRLVFVDVALPGMDGLQLSAKIKEYDRDIVVVILSGYMEFQFAQQAIDIGVLTYLVKHQLTPERLLDTLGKVRARIASRGNEQQIVRGQLLQALLRKELEYADLTGEQRERLRALKRPFQLLAFRPRAPYFRREEPAWQLPPDAADRLIESLFDDWSLLDTIPERGAIVALAAVPSAMTGGNAMLAAAHRQCAAIREYLQQHTGLDCSAAYLSKTSSLSSLPIDAVGLLDELDRAIFMDSPINAAQPAPRAESPDCGFISRNAFLNDYENTRRRIRQLMEDARRIRSPLLFSNCVDRVTGLLGEFHFDLAGSDNVPDNCFTAREVEQLLLSTLERAHRCIPVREEYSAATVFVLEYINDQYNKKPSVAEAARLLRSSGMYIGQKLKHETGRTFNEFLTECRVVHAKALLEQTGFKLCEISRMVGIANSAYFCRVFKAQTGLHPSEYRRRFITQRQEEVPS